MIKTINIKQLITNSGQIKDVPKNPRFIKDKKFGALKQSIKDTPELLDLRELIVYPFNDNFIILGGNMRFRAMKELGYNECQCKILDKNLNSKKIREIIIKDNRSFGADDVDLLANEWDIDELKDFGFEDWEFGEIEEEREIEDKGLGLTNKFQIIIDFENEQELKLEYDKLKQEGYKCQVFIL